MSIAAFVCRRNQTYYREYLRENFVTWRDEEDPERIEALLRRAGADADYIVNKVSAHAEQSVSREITRLWSLPCHHSLRHCCARRVIALMLC